MKDLKAIIKEKAALILDLETYLWEHPEIEMQEHGAKEQFCRMLKQEGFTVDANIPNLPTAFKAWKGNGKGPHIAMVSEYDALPGIGHACGHNLIGAMGFGAAIALAERISGQDGTVYLFGTPAEETGRGKPGLLDCGAFEGIDVAMMIHPNAKTILQSSMINLEGYDITFKGRTSHAAAAPEEGVNALDAAIQFWTGLGLLRQQIEDDSRVHGIITDGGEAPNVIPGRAVVRLEIRHPRLPYFRELVKRVLNVADAAALASGCTVEIEMFEPPIYCMKNNSILVDLFHQQMLADGVAEERITVPLTKSGGCSDMGNLSQVVPAIHPMMEMVGPHTIWHTIEFCEEAHQDFAQEQVLKGAQYLAGVGLQLFTEPGLVDKVWAEFKSQE